MTDTDEQNSLSLTSPAFTPGGDIPVQYSLRKGQNISPQLNISEPPAGTLSFVLIMHDPDAVSGDFLHWLLWDIPPSTLSIGTNSVPVGAIQGQSGMGDARYIGPAPPAGTGTHHYIFELYALDILLNLPTSATRQEVVAAMSGHILDQTTLTGLFTTDPA